MKKINLDELRLQPKDRRLSPRQRAAMERDDEIKALLNEAASLPPSEAVVISLGDDQKMPTLRAAVDRILRAEPRKLNWGVRGDRIVIRARFPAGAVGVEEQQRRGSKMPSLAFVSAPAIRSMPVRAGRDASMLSLLG